jgi:acid stress-induced BolA-like protein IbaG/YrbA
VADLLDLKDLEQRVEAEIDGAAVKASTDGYYYNIEVVSESFVGLRPVARQQMVYKALAALIADGSMHAVNIKALAPQEV